MTGEALDFCRKLYYNSVAAALPRRCFFRKEGPSLKTLKYSLRHSFPIMIAFFPIGLAYGILMQSSGYNALWSGACSFFVLAGSLQFLMVSFFGGGFSMLTIILLSLLLNSRHIFYGLSFIDKFRSFGPAAKWFLIFTLADENYSLHCSYRQEEGVNEKWAYVITAALVMFYWVAFSVLGGVAGSFITFSTQGIDFSLTALFAVILLDQMREAKSKLPVLIAAASSLLCIAVFGAGNFILPSLVMTIVLLLLLRGRLEPSLDGEEASA